MAHLSKNVPVAMLPWGSFEVVVSKLTAHAIAP